MKWFKHDSDAAQDAKLRKLIIKYGPTGYAIYFYCLELICSNVSENDITFELEHDAEIIADGLKVPGTADKAGADIVNEVMRYMISLGLFEASHDRITCMKMAKRLDQSMTSSPKMRQLIGAVKENHDPIMINHEKSCKTRLDKTRLEKSKKAKTATHPTLSVPIGQTRYDNLCREWGARVVDGYISRAVAYAEAHGKPYVDYAAAAWTYMQRDIKEGKLVARPKDEGPRTFAEAREMEGGLS